MQINGKNIKGIIFDLDGTLLDSCGVWKEIDEEFFKKRGMDVPPSYADAIAHLGLAKAAVYTKETYQLSETIEEIKEEWKEAAIYHYTNDIKVKAYVNQLLDYYKSKGIKLAVATANSKEFYEPCLKNNDIYNYFDYICDVNQFKGGKDKPDIYLKIADFFGLDSSEVAVFEDIPLALKTAKSAGFMTIGVYDRYQKDHDEVRKYAEVYVNSFDELLKKEEN